MRMPLLGKLLGANLLIALAALAVSLDVEHPGLVAVIAVALAIGFGVNALLVRLALRPLDELQRVAQQVSDGDLSARVVTSPIADRDIAELGVSFNRLLARVEGDRDRIQHLVRRSLRLRELERAGIADELRETTAQNLSALAMHLSAAVRECPDLDSAPNLLAARDIAVGMVSEVQRVAESVYPGLLGQFGLVSALEALGRRVAGRTNLDVNVSADGDNQPMPLALVTALYSVAEEAIRNVERHAHAGSVAIHLMREGDRVELTVEDDGLGFDVEWAERMSTGVGLFRVRELLAHAGGEVHISSAPGSRTRVVATATVHEDANP